MTDRQLRQYKCLCGFVISGPHTPTGQPRAIITRSELDVVRCINLVGVDGTTKADAYCKQEQPGQSNRRNLARRLRQTTRLCA